MRIGQYIHFGIGGADAAAENLIRGILTLPNIELVLFYNKWSLPAPSAVYDEGTPILSRFDNYADLKLIRIENVSEFNDHRLDVLGTHRSGEDQWALPGLESQPCNFKIVETNFHGLLGTKADYRIFPSAALVNHHHISIPHSVIPNPIMPSVTNDDFREELGIGQKFVFGRIARPTNDIYCDINLRAYKSLENDNSVMLYVAPCPQARADAARLAIKNIIFMESSTNREWLSKVYNTFDVLCHSTSIGETFGNTIAEAMMHRKPVVSHRGLCRNWPQAMSEVLGPTAEHLFVNADVAQYAETMLRLMNDRAFYQDMASKSYASANERFLYTKVAQKYMDVYTKVSTGQNPNDQTPPRAASSLRDARLQRRSVRRRR